MQTRCCAVPLQPLAVLYAIQEIIGPSFGNWHNTLGNSRALLRDFSR